jgi:hypothetical protein
MFWSFLYFLFYSEASAHAWPSSVSARDPFALKNTTAQIYQKELLGLKTKDNLTVTA